MTPSQSRQRGEGKMGCIISLAVIAIAGGIIYKAFPVYYANREMMDYVRDVGPKASGVQNPEAIETMLRTKAKELEISEILRDPNSLKVILVPSSGDSAGKCSIRVKYKRDIDFFGVYTYTMDTDETVISEIYTNIR